MSDNTSQSSSRNGPPSDTSGEECAPSSIKLTLQINDVQNFLRYEMQATSETRTLAGIQWLLSAQATGETLCLKLHAHHPSASEWRCRVRVALHSSSYSWDDPDGEVEVETEDFDEKSPVRQYDRWINEVDEREFATDNQWTIFCVLTALD